MFGLKKKTKQIKAEVPKKTKRQQKKDVYDAVEKFNRMNVKKPYVAIRRNGILLNPITKANPYLFPALPTALLTPSGSKYHK